MKAKEKMVIQFYENVELAKSSYFAYQEKLSDRSCHLGLASGKNLFLFFKKGIVAHLIGVQFSYLKNHPLFANKTSFECLMTLFEQPEKVEQEILRGTLDVSCMFSPFIKKKNLSLQKMPPLDCNFLHEIVFVCSYNKRIADDYSMNSPIHSDYIIGVRSSKNDINLLGIVDETPEDEKSFFKINSNLLIENGKNYFKDLKNIIGYQTLTYATHMNLYRQFQEGKLMFLTEEDKLNKIKNLEYYVDKLQVNIDVLGEVKTQLGKVMELKRERISNDWFYDLLLDCLRPGMETETIDYSNLNADQLELLYLIKNRIRRCENAEFAVRKIMGDLSEYCRQEELDVPMFYKR